VTPAELARLLPRLGLSHFPFRIDLDVDLHGLVVVLHVPERDSGAPTTMSHRSRSTIGKRRGWTYALSGVVDEEQALGFIRRCLLDALEHEVDECLTLDGKRVRDPHEHHADPECNF